MAAMRLLIFGDRNWNNQQVITLKLGELFAKNEIECVIEGEARGADTMGRIAAEGFGIPVIKFPALWDKYGRAAGPIRNQQQLREGKPTHAIGFHNNIDVSKGSKDMYVRCLNAGIPVEIFTEAC